MPADRSFNVGIFGGSGMTGGELLRWLVGHPKFKIAFLHSRHHAGKPVASVHAHLSGMTDLSFSGEAAASLASKADVVFLAFDGSEAMKLAAELSSYPGILVDLTGDHRLKDPSLYPRMYGFEHTEPDALKTFTYGLTEIHRNELRVARRIANPGCFATAAILASAPICRDQLASHRLFVSAVTGSSGAGMSLRATTHHPVRDGNLFAYRLFHHQHEPEIAQTLAEVAGKPVDFTLATHSGPFVRGIHATLHTTLKTAMKSEPLAELFKSFYGESPFIRIRNEPPQLKAVVGSNFCDLHVTTRGREAIVVSALDNLVKGAVGQAIANANLAVGLPETEGLWQPPLYP